MKKVIKPIELIFCMDATGSMVKFWERFVNVVPTIYPTLEENFGGLDGIAVSVKVIAFKDYTCDPDPMTESQFFTLPEEQDDLITFLKSMEIEGGGDIPENGLEALVFAMRAFQERAENAKTIYPDSGETQYRRTKRVMIMFTDAEPHPLQDIGWSMFYPTDLMPADMSGFYDMWRGLDENGGHTKLLLVAPTDSPFWSDLKEYSSAYYETKEAGLQDFEVEKIADILAVVIRGDL